MAEKCIRNSVQNAPQYSESATRKNTVRKTSGRKMPNKAGSSMAAAKIGESSTRNDEIKTRRRLSIETRAQMLERLTNPTISLHEASIILGVCSATVRRYTDMGTLLHTRTEGGQRRFRLREVLALARALETKKRKR